jgi:hypothetical protein
MGGCTAQLSHGTQTIWPCPHMSPAAVRVRACVRVCVCVCVCVWFLLTSKISSCDCNSVSAHMLVSGRKV